MSRPPVRNLSRLSRDAQRLVSLTQALANSGSKLEDNYWEKLLDQQLFKLLQGRRNKHTEHALEYLLANSPDAYEILVEQAETCSESTRLASSGQNYDVLLFSAPIVAWTRYQLPDGTLGQDTQQALARQLQTHILADGARLALVPQLVQFEQMPQTFQDVSSWTRQLGAMALGGKAETLHIDAVDETEGMLADARFLIGAIAVPEGAALFRWQHGSADTAVRDHCFQEWAQAYAQAIGPLFTGCTVEYLHPDAYYTNSREADRRIRPLALKAAITWLHTAAGLAPAELRATIAACGDTMAEEFRVGFSTRQSNDVIYGCVWPVLSKEEALPDDTDTAEADIPEQIAALLKELGVQDIRRLPGLNTAEYCEDCGAPYFPNPLGEMLHPELPEEVDLSPVHFH
jgi:hypothetical protein